MEMDFDAALREAEKVVKAMNIQVEYTHCLDEFFKGDLDGQTILIRSNLPAEERLFNLLHLAGHTIQWNTDEHLRVLGSQLYQNPGEELLHDLLAYEWEASCYALGVLHQAGITGLDQWLYDKCVVDMSYLTHYYKTGEKRKSIIDAAEIAAFGRTLEPKFAPPFTPRASVHSRNGIVIAF
jgi:hypothetical protein